MYAKKVTSKILSPSSRRDRHFYSVWRRFQNSTPRTYRRTSLEICRLVYGPELPDKAFADLSTLQQWYRAVLHAWLTDSLRVADFWRERLPALENELALSCLVLEARSNGVRRIQRRLFRERDGVPRDLPITSYSELSFWSGLMFELLNDDDQHVDQERQTLTIRYDKGVAYRLEEERKDLIKQHDEWVAGFTHSMMTAVSKGEPHTLEPDDDWLLVVWGSLANPQQSVREATVSLFVDAKSQPKQSHTALLEEIISATWKAMRRLGPVCRDEPRATNPKQLRRHLDAVKRFCARQDSEFSKERFAINGSPSLGTSNFRKILKIIQGTFVEMERHPRAYHGKGEEDLRDHLLTVLASHYPNSTGETYNKKGKTDILIRHEGENVFVGECKFWKGLRGFYQTIDRALDYLTWRESYAAIVCFVTKHKLNPVLTQIADGTPRHPCFIRCESKNAESWMQSEFRLKSDATRNVHLAVLCFHFPPN
jgi:hypothetical protein